MTSTAFPVDGLRVRQLSATRQGRVALGGFAYQTGYAVARLASLYTRRQILETEGIPRLLRFDWAEDLEEIDQDGRAVLAQCKRISDIGQVGSLSEILVGFAPKWLWTPEDRRPALRFRLVCADRRFAGRGLISLRDLGSRAGGVDRGAVLAAAVACLVIPPGPRSDRALWQADAEAAGFDALCAAVWEQTEVLYLPPYPLADDPAGPLFHAERDALALLVRMQAVAPSRQKQALAALRSLLHGNVVEFDPTGTGLIPVLDREPRIVGYDDLYYALFDLLLPVEEAAPFLVVARQVLEQAAAEPKRPFVARRPRWSDVIHGQDGEVKFLEREMTDTLVARVRDELLAPLGAGEALPALFVLGAPGAGKSTLVLRTAARIVQQGLAVVAAPKLNLDTIEEDEHEAFLQALSRLEEGALPVLLVLDDPFFADSGWVDLLRRLAMEASAGVSFATIIDRIWIALNRGLPIEPALHPEKLPWTVRAYLVACGFHRFYLRCSETLLRAVLACSGKDQPAGGFDYELRRLVDEHGWSVFSVAEPEANQRFLGLRIGAAHPRIAAEAWRRRPAPAFDIGDWLIHASLDASGAAMDIGALAGRIEQEEKAGEAGLLVRLITLWNRAATDGEINARNLSLLHSSLLENAPAFAHRLWPGLEACVQRVDSQSWLAFLAMSREPVPGAQTRQEAFGFDLLGLIRLADFYLANSRAIQFMNLLRSQPSAYAAFIARLVETSAHPQAYWLLAALVAANPVDETVRTLAGDWIDENWSHPKAYALLAPLVVSNPANETVRKLAGDWIVENWSHAQVYWLLASLVASNPEEETVRNLATDWIGANQDHPQVDELLRALVAANPGDETVCKLATDWIGANWKHPQVYVLLAPLVTANPEEETVRELATDWIGANQDHPQVQELLRALVAANPADESIGKKAVAWVEANFDDDRSTSLLSTLIARSDGTDDGILGLGESYLAKSRARNKILVMGSLLTAGKAAPRYIELALRSLPSESGKGKANILRGLSKAASHNLSAVLGYVAACADEYRKKTVLRSIAIGIQRRPQALEGLLEGRIETLSAADAGALLVRLLDLGIVSEDLCRFVGRRLAESYRRPGYGFLLRAVRRNPAALGCLLAIPELDGRVLADLRPGP